MTSDDAVVAVIRALNAIGVPYMVTGSLVSNLYGIVRSTKDADFLLISLAIDVAKLRSLLGPELLFDPQLSFETVTGTTVYRIRKRTGEPFTIELFQLRQDPHDQERFRRRQPTTMLGEPIFLPTPEDVIITKLRWSKLGKRKKDVDDVRNVIAVQGARVDWEYVQRWCDEHGTRDLLEEVRGTIPKTGA